MAVDWTHERTLKLLVCDDDELDRLRVRRMLKDASVRAECSECDSSKGAAALLEREPFDCVVLDFNLPDESGLALLRRLRGNGDQTPVVMLTGQESTEVAVTLMKQGASDYLPKATLTSERLAQSIRHAVDLAFARAQVLQAQAALRASEAFNRRMLAASADCIKVLGLDGALLSMNDGGRRSLEITDISGVLGTDWTLFWSGDDREAARAAIARARAGGTGHFRGVSPSTTGKTLHWDVVVSPIVGASGQPEKLLAISRDVTAEHSRRSFEQQLLGIVSHDLRNPLHAIRMSTEMLLRSDELSDKGLRSVNRIRTSSDRAIRMIHDLLDFTRAQLGGRIAITREEVDLAGVISQVVEEVRVAWPDRRVDASAPAPLIAHVDPDRIAQVLTNVLSNALQYSPPDTVVSLNVERSAGHIELSVHNAGDPIPADRQKSIFEPLQRGTSVGNSVRSIGLGLYIVRHLVEAHGGEVSVSSSAEQGTTFTVRLPANETAKESSAA